MHCLTCGTETMTLKLRPAAQVSPCLLHLTPGPADPVGWSTVTCPRCFKVLAALGELIAVGCLGWGVPGLR